MTQCPGLATVGSHYTLGLKKQGAGVVPTTARDCLKEREAFSRGVDGSQPRCKPATRKRVSIPKSPSPPTFWSPCLAKFNQKIRQGQLPGTQAGSGEKWIDRSKWKILSRAGPVSTHIYTNGNQKNGGNSLWSLESQGGELHSYGHRAVALDCGASVDCSKGLGMCERAWRTLPSLLAVVRVPTMHDYSDLLFLEEQTLLLLTPCLRSQVCAKQIRNPGASANIIKAEFSLSTSEWAPGLPGTPVVPRGPAFSAFSYHANYPAVTVNHPSSLPALLSDFQMRKADRSKIPMLLPKLGKIFNYMLVLVSR